MWRSCFRVQFGTPREGERAREVAQDGRLAMTGAEKYAKVCREGAALGTGRCSLMTPSTKQYLRPHAPIKIERSGLRYRYLAL